MAAFCVGVGNGQSGGSGQNLQAAESGRSRRTRARAGHQTAYTPDTSQGLSLHTYSRPLTVNCF